MVLIKTNIMYDHLHYVVNCLSNSSPQYTNFLQNSTYTEYIIKWLLFGVALTFRFNIKKKKKYSRNSKIKILILVRFISKF